MLSPAPYAPPAGPLPASLGAIGTRGVLPTDINAALKQFNSATVHYIHEDVDAIGIVLPSFYCSRSGGAETGLGGPITYTASIEVLGTGVRTPVTFGGAPSVSVPSLGWQASDLAPVRIRRSHGRAVPILVRIYGASSAGIVYATSSDTLAKHNPLIGEAFQYAASGLSDLTMAGTPTSTASTYNNVFAPVAVIGLTTRRSFGIIGDSRAFGQGDVARGQASDLGEVARGIGAGAGYINMSVPGTKISDVIASHALRVAILNAYASDIIVQTKINDIAAAGASAGTIIANLGTIAGYFPAKRVWISTASPAPTSSDAFATAANQTTMANEAVRSGVNAAIRAKTIAGQYGAIDLAAALEDPANPGKWATTGYAGNAVCLADGVHPSELGYQQIALRGVVPVAAMLA